MLNIQFREYTLTLQKTKNLPMDAQRQAGEKQLHQPFSTLDFQYLLPASPEPK